MAKLDIDPSMKGAIGRHGGGGEHITLPSVPAWLTPLSAQERYDLTAPRKKGPILRERQDDDPEDDA